MVRWSFREVQEQSVMPATVPRTVTASGKFTLSQRLKRKKKRGGKKGQEKIKAKPASWCTVNIADQHKPVTLGYSEPLRLPVGILGASHGTCPDQPGPREVYPLERLGSGHHHRSLSPHITSHAFLAIAVTEGCCILTFRFITTKYIQNFPFGSIGLMFSKCTSF